MKRLLALMLTAVLSLSLAACGGDTTGDGGAMSKEEMLEQATFVEMVDVHNTIMENLAQGNQLYGDKILKLEGKIYDIGSDHISMSDVGYVYVNIYLPVEEIVELKNGQTITVVGKTEDKILEDTMEIMGTTFDSYILNMPTAYLATDRYEYIGTIVDENDSYSGAWNVRMEGRNVLPLVYFSDGINVSEYVGKEVTFTAKRIDGKFCDAEILE